MSEIRDKEVLEENIEDVDLYVDDYFLKNSKYYEKLYLNQGKSQINNIKHESDNLLPKSDNPAINANQINLERRKTAMTNFTFKVTADDNLTHTQIQDHIFNEKYNLNNDLDSKEENKMKVLYYNFNKTCQDNNLKIKEKELETKSKIEVEAKIYTMKEEMEKNFELKCKKIEEHFNQIYEKRVIEIKCKIREEKEQKLYQNMYQKFKPIVEAEIYKNEFSKIEEKIKNQIEKRLETEFKEKKIIEIEKLKKKYEITNKNKIDEIESRVKQKCKEEYELLLKLEIDKKERYLKALFMKKYENFKIKLEIKLEEQYLIKEKDLYQKVNDIKAKFFRQKCAENIKVKNFYKLKDQLDIKPLQVVSKQLARSKSSITIIDGRNILKEEINGKSDVLNNLSEITISNIQYSKDKNPNTLFESRKEDPSKNIQLTPLTDIKKEGILSN